jgi:protein-L-isoaspartate(D-aspartate) O-methyltransferase
MDPWLGAREDMVRVQLRGRDISDERVLEAMRRVPRHEFVPEDLRHAAYDDRPLPIGYGQTISQPYIVALMTQLALGEPLAHASAPLARALDVGTGSGYQAAVLAELVPEVHSVEIVPELAARARARLSALGYTRVSVHDAEGRTGWPDAAPYDAIIAACAARELPDALVAQLAPGGRLVLPLGGTSFQELWRIAKRADGSLERKPAGGVAFVPMLSVPHRSV